MQEYLYFKNNMSAMQKQEEEQRKIKKILKEQLQREFMKKSAPKSNGTLSTNGTASEMSGYSPAVQAAVDYANRQLQQKIKTEMLAKMEKMTGGAKIKRSKS